MKADMYIEITVGPEDSRVDDEARMTASQKPLLFTRTSFRDCVILSKCFDSLSRYANAYNLSFLLIL